MTFSRHVPCLCSAALALLFATPAAAQSRHFRMRPISPHESSTGYREVVVSMPAVSLTHEMAAHLELNLDGLATLALEGTLMGRREEVPADRQKTTGESLVDQGRGASLLISRYWNGARMSGAYWSLGAGYREEQAKWHVKPDQNDKEVDMSLVDSDHMLNHEATLKGMTGHARFGYRYVGSNVPVVVGAYLGLRHFQPSVKDMPPASNDAGSTVTYAELTDSERQTLRNISMTSPEGGIELGFAF